MNKDQVVLDIECYRNYFLVMFKNYEGKKKYFEMYGDEFDGKVLDIEGIKKVLYSYEIVTFNGNNYDIPILTYAMSGACCDYLKQASDDIIVGNLKPWEFYKRYGLEQPKINHIDLIEPAPAVNISLKLYGGRMHSKRLQDLPIEPDAMITEEQRSILVEYCANDLDTTIDLLNATEDRINLRRTMGVKYGLDLRSKSDAQIAESVIKQEVEKITGNKVRKGKVVTRSFYYTKPDFVRFDSEQLQNALEIVLNSEFISESNGVIKMSDELANLDIEIGQSTYQLGMGGLHSKEHEVYHTVDEDYDICDFDVGSYYPNIFLQLALYPEALGPDFLTVFNDITKTRLKAKKDGNKLVADSMKIMINGTFGKTGSIYSVLFAPNLMIQTTVTGQLALLMLIERLEKYGISIVSANTDGIVMKVPKAYRESRLLPIIKAWEKHTGFEMEETQYSAVYSRDVNSYIAIKTDGKVKTKGFFATGGLQKSPTNEVCSKAFVEYLKNGTPIEDFIRNHDDFRDFLSVRTVKGGAVKDGEYLGKVVRWYYSTETNGTINYKTNGNKVPRTDCAQPCMLLPDEFPSDLDYDWYIKEANSFFYDVGLKPRPIPTKIPRRNTKAWKELFEQGIIVEFDGKFVHKDDLAWMT